MFHIDESRIKLGSNKKPFMYISDESSSYLSQNHKEMLGQYELMYENMLRINTTVEYLLNTVQNMQRNLDDRINWFSHLLNVAGKKPYFNISLILILSNVASSYCFLCYKSFPYNTNKISAVKRRKCSSTFAWLSILVAWS